MSAANKRKGSALERDALQLGRDRGHQIERLRLAGREDEGDLALQGGYGLVTILEAKNRARFTPGPWMDEAVLEASNWAKHRNHLGADPIPAVLAKRRMKGIEDAFLILRYGDYLDINKLLRHRHDKA